MLLGVQLKREILRAMAGTEIRSIAALARRARIQRDTLYAWFRGERPPKPDTLKKVADALGVRVGDLWDYEPKEVAGVSGAGLAEIRAMVAEAVELGVTRALAQLGAAGVQPPPRQLRPRR